MKKRLISITAAAAMILACSNAVIAEDKIPTVYVNTSEIIFDDQTPVILGEGTTLVPARGVFEAMGATVKWDGDTRMVEVESADHKTCVKLTIDDSTMKVYDLSGMLGSLLTNGNFDAPETSITLDVAPQIINDRTMIPLRAISEAIDSDVQWNGEDYAIDITTADAPSADAALPIYSLSASAPSVAEGEMVDIYINLANIPADSVVTGVAATIKYDKDNFELVNSTLVNGDTDIESTIGASNPEFADGVLKIGYIHIDPSTAASTDGKIMKLTFKSINGKEGSFTLFNSYHTLVGFGNELYTETTGSEPTPILYNGTDLKLDTTTLVVNGADAPAATATAAPEATSAPESTTAPEATSAPESTTVPAATLAPASTLAPTATPEAN